MPGMVSDVTGQGGPRRRIDWRNEAAASQSRRDSGRSSLRRLMCCQSFGLARYHSPCTERGARWSDLDRRRRRSNRVRPHRRRPGPHHPGVRLCSTELASPEPAVVGTPARPDSPSPYRLCVQSRACAFQCPHAGTPARRLMHCTERRFRPQLMFDRSHPRAARTTRVPRRYPRLLANPHACPKS